MRRCLFCIYVLLLAGRASGHALSAVIQPIQNRSSRNGRLLHPTPPTVLLFLHFPKCGGSTVRKMFQRAHGWHVTYWSLTQRFHGWKANRLLAAIRVSLAANRSRTFVEWHIGINWTAVRLHRRT